MDLIIPTMWRIDEFPKVLESYSRSPFVNNIIIIDNDHGLRPALDLPKVKLACFGVNIFVNPAWNEGYWRATSDIIGILNDDIFVPDEVFERVLSLDFDEIGLLGFDPSFTEDTFLIEEINLDKSKPVGSQCFGFGVCMFLARKDYKVIPNLYEVWFGDDYLCRNNKAVHRFKSKLVTGRVSGTINSERKVPRLQERIDLDTKNAYQHLIHNGSQ